MSRSQPPKERRSRGDDEQVAERRRVRFDETVRTIGVWHWNDEAHENRRKFWEFVALDRTCFERRIASVERAIVPILADSHRRSILVDRSRRNVASRYDNDDGSDRRDANGGFDERIADGERRDVSRRNIEFEMSGGGVVDIIEKNGTTRYPCPASYK